MDARDDCVLLSNRNPNLNHMHFYAAEPRRQERVVLLRSGLLFEATWPSFEEKSHCYERKYQEPRKRPLTPPPTLLTTTLTEFDSVRWNGPGQLQLEVPPRSSLNYFRAIGATTSPMRTYCSRLCLLLL